MIPLPFRVLRTVKFHDRRRDIILDIREVSFRPQYLHIAQQTPGINILRANTVCTLTVFEDDNAIFREEGNHWNIKDNAKVYAVYKGTSTSSLIEQSKPQKASISCPSYFGYFSPLLQLLFGCFYVIGNKKRFGTDFGGLNSDLPPKSTIKQVFGWLSSNKRKAHSEFSTTITIDMGLRNVSFDKLIHPGFRRNVADTIPMLYDLMFEDDNQTFWNWGDLTCKITTTNRKKKIVLKKKPLKAKKNNGIR